MGCRQANFCFVCGLKQIGETDEEASSRREADRRWMQEHRSKLEQEYRAEKERFEAEWQAKLGVIQVRSTEFTRPQTPAHPPARKPDGPSDASRNAPCPLSSQPSATRHPPLSLRRLPSPPHRSTRRNS